jgi:hypothetical protein
MESYNNDRDLPVLWGWMNLVIGIDGLTNK